MVTTDPIEPQTVFPGPHHRTPSTSAYVRTQGLTNVCNEVLMPRHQLELADYPTRRFEANIGDSVIQKNIFVMVSHLSKFSPRANIDAIDVRDLLTRRLDALRVLG